MVMLDNRLQFPDPRNAPSHGHVAVGGDLSIERLLLAYQSGLFPWYNDGEPICWWSPDPRMIFNLQGDTPIKISKSLKQSRRNRGYRVEIGTCFDRVIQNCAKIKRVNEEGTWINDDMLQAYVDMNKAGHASSVAVFKDDDLVGGLYGVDMPDQGIFCGESMFSYATDASKIALWALTEYLIKKNYRLIDAQLYNDHLSSLGAIEIDRDQFLDYLQS
ncbi:MAG: leucyl/phenylalanyl-tRNA--protein transferase [Nonlabens sp.]